MLWTVCSMSFLHKFLNEHLKVNFTYLYTNGPTSTNFGFSPLRNPSGLVTLKIYTFVNLITPGRCQ